MHGSRHPTNVQTTICIIVVGCTLLVLLQGRKEGRKERTDPGRHIYARLEDEEHACRPRILLVRRIVDRSAGYASELDDGASEESGDEAASGPGAGASADDRSLPSSAATSRAAPANGGQEERGDEDHAAGAGHCCWLLLLLLLRPEWWWRWLLCVSRWCVCCGAGAMRGGGACVRDPDAIFGCTGPAVPRSCARLLRCCRVGWVWRALAEVAAGWTPVHGGRLPRETRPWLFVARCSCPARSSRLAAVPGLEWPLPAARCRAIGFE